MKSHKRPKGSAPRGVKAKQLKFDRSFYRADGNGWQGFICVGIAGYFSSPPKILCFVDVAIKLPPLSVKALRQTVNCVIQEHNIKRSGFCAELFTASETACFVCVSAR
jgi:hypothetical protein